MQCLAGTLPFMIAVVAEWLRRLTRNQIPSGSVGSNPTDCVIFFFFSQVFWSLSMNFQRPMSCALVMATTAVYRTLKNPKQ